MPNEPKLHHFPPEAYLRRFADERGDLWVIDRKQGIVRRQSPEVTAAERELYTLEDDDGARDRGVESALAGFVDGPGQHAIRVLDEGGTAGRRGRGEAGDLRGGAVRPDACVSGAASSAGRADARLIDPRRCRTSGRAIVR